MSTQNYNLALKGYKGKVTMSTLITPVFDSGHLYCFDVHIWVFNMKYMYWVGQ